MQNFELSVLDFIQQNLRSSVGDTVMVWITRLGDSGAVWILLTLVLLLLPRYRKFGFAMGFALLLDLLCCNLLLKPLLARVRPCDVNTAVQLLIAHPAGFSFPSGHTAASFSAASALFFSGSRLWIPAGFLAAAIAFSRLYLYVHYPTDILGGILLGIGAGYLSWRLSQKALRRVCFKKSS